MVLFSEAVVVVVVEVVEAVVGVLAEIGVADLDVSVVVIVEVVEDGVVSLAGGRCRG